MCGQQTDFTGALKTLSTHEAYEIYCLLEVLQPNKKNLLTERNQGEGRGEGLGGRMETKQNIKYE